MTAPDPNDEEFSEPTGEEFEFEEPDFPDPETAEFDYREPGTPSPVSAPNPDLLAMADRYLEDANAVPVVRHHIPLPLIVMCARVADRYNRRHTTHWFGPGLPFKYSIHLTLLGASGHGKGATVDQFFEMISDRGPADREIFPTYEFKGGSIESIRGGIPSGGGNWWVKPGSLERTSLGFLHVPEFTQLAELEQRRSGAIQSILAWADTGEMEYDTISGGAVEYGSSSTLILGLQVARLTDVEEVVLGWNRRSVYDHFVPPMISDILPENRAEASPGNALLLRELREGIRGVITGWAPTSVDWSPFKAWLSDAYRNHWATITDEQMLYSVALGYHIATGGARTGDVTISVSPNLHRTFERLLWNKRMARIGRDRRTANDALDVLLDPLVIGVPGSKMRTRFAIQVVAARLSIDEELASKAVSILIDRKKAFSIANESGDDVIEIVPQGYQ